MSTLGRKFMSAAALGALSAVTGLAEAGGFAIGTQSGSGTGNAFAGGAAVADDVSVAWSNPAGMALLPAGMHAAGALHVIKPSFKFRNGGSTGAFAAPGTGEGGDGGDWAFIPNGFFKMNINPQLTFGLALNVPFGLKTQYDQGWRGQLTGLKSEIRTINVNPSLAYKITDKVSIGAGVSVQKVDAELTAFAGSAATGNLNLDADDVGYGFNVGMMFQAAPNARIGATYRSSIKYELEGTAGFTGTSAALLGSGVRADLRVPEMVSVSFLVSPNPKWDLMGDVTWTRWSRLQRLVVTRTSATPAGAAAGSTLTSLAFNWQNTWRFGLGANYKMNDQTKLRFGLAWDETPTNDVDRTARLPDQDRTWLAIGVQHRISKSGVLDVGYAHEFIRDAAINNPITTAAGVPIGSLRGTFDNKADILSVQYSHSF